MTKLVWPNQCLFGTIPADIGALTAFTHLHFGNNELTGSILPTIGALANFTAFYLRDNPLSSVVPSTLSNLTNLECMDLCETDFSNAPTLSLYRNSVIQNYLLSLERHPTIRLLNYGNAITKKRQASLERRISPHRAPPPPRPFFAFLADYEQNLTDLILSFLDPPYCCNKDRTALLKC